MRRRDPALLILLAALLLAAPAFAALLYYEWHPALMWTPANGRRADSVQAAIPTR